MPFCVVKGHLLTCKRACFATQKGTFYNPLCNLLILRRLQGRFLMIISWFANNSAVWFVRVFQKPEQKLGTASPRPSPKGEGEQLARFPGVIERTEWGKSSLSPALSEGRGGIISEIPRYVWGGRSEEKTSLSPALSEGRGGIISEIPWCV